MILERRKFLIGLGGLIAAPAVVQLANIMPVSAKALGPEVIRHSGGFMVLWNWGGNEWRMIGPGDAEYDTRMRQLRAAAAERRADIERAFDIHHQRGLKFQGQDIVFDDGFHGVYQRDLSSPHDLNYLKSVDDFPIKKIDKTLYSRIGSFEAARV